jgi:CheY-like chemotaxis protein
VTGATILLVEDDPAIRDSLAECLAIEGYAVESVTNGLEALRRLARAPRPGLVLADLAMPVMGGAELLKRLRADPALSGMPVVLMTAALPPGEAGVVGADGYLAKPFEIEELFAVVRRLIRKEG